MLGRLLPERDEWNDRLPRLTAVMVEEGPCPADPVRLPGTGMLAAMFALRKSFIEMGSSASDYNPV